MHFCSEYDSAVIHDKIFTWFDLQHPPTAIFCADDQLVPDVYRSLEELRKRIPEDVSVLGRGDLSVGTALRPQLTTFAIQPFEMGKKAAELLIEVMQTRSAKVRRIYLDAPLIMRESA
jgi:DNA-binding LacI/PurR family transcriptional regulator